MSTINGYAIAVSMLDSAIQQLKTERKEIEDQLVVANARVVAAHVALDAMYTLRYDLKKPEGHKPTRDALRRAEKVLYGFYSTPED